MLQRRLPPEMLTNKTKAKPRTMTKHEGKFSFQNPNPTLELHDQTKKVLFQREKTVNMI